MVNPDTAKASDDLLLVLLKDRIPTVPIDHVARSFVVPLAVLLVAARELESRPSAVDAGDAPRFASEVWRRIADRFPSVGCFPLGPAVERATKRTALVVIDRRRRAAAPQDHAATAPRIVGLFASLWLAEIALTDLRGSARALRDDLGFLYHFTPDGRPRTLREEGEVRAGLHHAAQRLAPRIAGPWMSQLRSGTPDPRALVTALQDTLSVPLRKPSASSHRVDVLAVPRTMARTAAGARDVSHARHIYFGGPGANGRMDLSELVAAGGPLDARVADLIDIAATVYLADIYLPRDAALARGFSFVIGVRRPELWNRHAETLGSQIAFLSLNETSLHFVQRGSAGRTAARRKGTAPADACVALFSGGLDSFAGACRLVSEGRPAVLVSHDPGPMVRGIQRRLATALGAKDAAAGARASLTSVRIPVRADPSAPALNRLGVPPPQVLYQHTRSFLFLSLAAAVAQQRGLKDILVFENGPVALNPAFSEARTNTRTTHPAFLQAFERMVRDVFDADVRVQNPFELLTKAEVAQSVDERRHALLRHTNSCWSYSKVKLWAKTARLARFAGGHCGRCLPCIWRRAAMQKAGLADADGEYLWDALPKRARERWASRVHLTVLLDQLRFCRNVLALPPEALLHYCPDLVDGQGTLEERLALIRRFSSEINDWFDTTGGSLVGPATRYHLAAPPDRTPPLLDD